MPKLSPLFIVTRREIRDQFRDWRIIAPILVLTLFFPGLMNFVARQIVEFVESFDVPVIGQRMVPFLLMVVGFFPISISLVIALESFVGESERRSIEPLLSSPLTDFQLYTGKLLAVMVPPVGASLLGIFVYLLGVYRQMDWVPEPIFLVQVLTLTIVQALLMVSGAVVISSQTTSTRAANLLASFIVVPMALLLIWESLTIFWGDYDILWLIIFGQVVIAALLVRMGLAHFNREHLLGRELGTINLRWSWQVFKRAFQGGAQAGREWYRGVLGKTLKQVQLPALFSLLLVSVGVGIGAWLSNNINLPRELVNTEQMTGTIPAQIQGLGIQFFSFGSIFTVFMHNLRVLIFATAFGIFSFGVLGIAVIMLPFAIIGFLFGVISGLGISPWLFFAATILPHGILEIPAIVLGGAAILKVGATLATPTPGRTISEAMLISLGDWARIMLGIVVPLLLGAAILEIYLTPTIVMRVFGG